MTVLPASTPEAVTAPGTKLTVALPSPSWLTPLYPQATARVIAHCSTKSLPVPP